MQYLCGQQANTNFIHLLALFLQKKHIFVWHFGRSANICAVYKFSLTGGLTLHLGLIWLLLLPLDILLSEFIVHVSSLSFLSVFRWYSFRWFCIFLYIVPLFLAEASDFGWIPSFVCGVQVHGTLAYMIVMCG